jgi:hypothetical protein
LLDCVAAIVLGVDAVRIGEGRENARAGKIVRTLLTVVAVRPCRGDGMGGRVRRGGDEHPLDRNTP